jgi:hypothetical protein
VRFFSHQKERDLPPLGSTNLEISFHESITNKSEQYLSKSQQWYMYIIPLHGVANVFGVQMLTYGLASNQPMTARSNRTKPFRLYT